MTLQRNQKKVFTRIALILCVLAILVIGGEDVRAQPLRGGYDCSSQSIISFEDCVVLGTLYVETGGISWTTSTNWLASSDPCTWYGITCGAGTPHRPIISIILNGNNLIGMIPEELGTLTSLTYLGLSSNGLYAPIPSELGNIPSLESLFLNNNFLEGSLPPSLGYLSNLTHLLLNNNNIVGDVPAEIGNLTNLVYLYFDDNPLLGGGLPQSLINLSALDYLTFHGTSICEPQNPSFQGWITSVLIVSGTGLTCELFIDDFETGDFSLWTRFNDGKGYLYPCHAAAINGSWGACVDRGTDKRKQLIDETPVWQVHYMVRFNFDINSLSMAEGTRFRFMQVKMGAERPFFLVLKRQGGQYKVQLNALIDGITKLKTAWYPLSNAPHTIEVDWHAATGAGNNDGNAALYIDDILQAMLMSLDNDTIYVDTFKIGFTSRLDGKPISGIFYLDDIATSNLTHLGLP